MRVSGLITVCVLSYNQYHYLFECIDSVLTQDHPQIELVVHNDGTSDFDAQKVREYIEAHKRGNLKNYVVVNNPQRLGTVRNANLAIKAATGEFIKLLAADDKLLVEDALSSYYEIFEKEKAEVVLAKANVYDAYGVYVRQYPESQFFSFISKASPKELYERLISVNIVHSPSVCMRKSFIETMGGLDGDYYLAEDWPLWLKLSRLGYKIHTLNKTVINYRMGGVSNSEDEKMLQYKEECWNDIFKLYDKEVIPYKRQIDPKLYNQAMYFLKKQKLMALRDFKYKASTSSQRFFYQIEIKKFVIARMLKTRLHEYASQIQIQDSSLTILFSLAFFFSSGLFQNASASSWLIMVLRGYGFLCIIVSIINGLFWLLIKSKSRLQYLFDKLRIKRG